MLMVGRDKCKSKASEIVEFRALRLSCPSPHSLALLRGLRNSSVPLLPSPGQLADSIVSKGRETLERAIKTVEATSRWGGKVIYGDTDR